MVMKFDLLAGRSWLLGLLLLMRRIRYGGINIFEVDGVIIEYYGSFRCLSLSLCLVRTPNTLRI